MYKDIEWVSIQSRILAKVLPKQDDIPYDGGTTSTCQPSDAWALLLVRALRRFI